MKKSPFIKRENFFKNTDIFIISIIKNESSFLYSITDITTIHNNMSNYAVMHKQPNGSFALTKAVFSVARCAKNNSIIFGNLPYNISSQILVKIIKFKKNPPSYSSLILMFQKEMAERILAKYGALHYGRLSILTSYKLQICNKFNVSPNCFYPKPKVNSTVLYFKPKDQISYNIKNMENGAGNLYGDFSNLQELNLSIRKMILSYLK